MFSTRLLNLPYVTGFEKTLCMVEFDGSWDEEDVMKYLVDAFVAVLDPNASAPRYNVIMFT